MGFFDALFGKKKKKKITRNENAQRTSGRQGGAGKQVTKTKTQTSTPSYANMVEEKKGGGYQLPKQKKKTQTSTPSYNNMVTKDKDGGYSYKPESRSTHRSRQGTNVASSRNRKTGNNRVWNTIRGAVEGWGSGQLQTAATAHAKVNRGAVRHREYGTNSKYNRNRGSNDRRTTDSNYTQNRVEARKADERFERAVQKTQSVADTSSREASRYAYKLNERSQQHLNQAKEGASGLGKFGVDAASNIIQMGMDAATGNTLASMFTRSLGSGYMSTVNYRQQKAIEANNKEFEEASKNVKTQDEYDKLVAEYEARNKAIKGDYFNPEYTEGAGLYALGQAGKEVATEKMFNVFSPFAKMYGKGTFSGVEEAAEKKLAASLMKRGLSAKAAEKIAKGGLGAISEGVEEVASDIGEFPLNAAMESLYGQQFGDNPTAKDMLYDFAIGGAVAGLMGGGAHIANTVMTGGQKASTLDDDARYKVLEDAQNLSEDSDAYKRATQLMQQEEAGLPVWDSDIKQLEYQIAEARGAEEHELEQKEREYRAQKAKENEAVAGDTTRIAQDAKIESRSEVDALNEIVSNEVKKTAETVTQVFSERGHDVANDPTLAAASESIGRILMGTATTEDFSVGLTVNPVARQIVQEMTGLELPTTNEGVRTALRDFTIAARVSNEDAFVQQAKEIAYSNFETSDAGMKSLKAEGGEVYSIAQENLQAVPAARREEYVAAIQSYAKGAEVGAVARDKAFYQFVDQRNKKYHEILPENVRRAVYDAAYRKAEQKLSENGGIEGQTENASEGKKSGKRKAPGKVTFEAKTIRTNEGKEIKTKDITQKDAKKKLGKNVYGVLRGFARVTGININFYSLPNSPFNGYHQSGTVHINIDAENPLNVLLHEVTHELQETAPKQYEKLKRFVFETMYNADAELYEKKIDSKIRSYERAGEILTREGAEDEILADATDDMFRDSDLFGKLVDYDKPLAQRLLDSLRNVLKALHDALNLYPSARTGQFLEDLGILEEAEQMWVEALNESVGVEGAVDESGARFDISKKSHHTAEQRRIIDEYNNAVNPDAMDLFNRIRNGEKVGKKKVTVGHVSAKAATDILANTPDVYKDGFDPTGYSIRLGKSFYSHVEKRHGVNGKADNTMADDKDKARVGYVVENYDEMSPGDTSGEYRMIDKNGNTIKAPTVVLSKKINGTAVIIEAVPDSNKREIVLVSAYMKKEGSQTPNANAPGFTSGNASYAPSNNNVPNSEQNVNDSFVRLSPQRMDSLIEEYAIPGNARSDYSKAWIATIHPRDFLKLTVKDEVLDTWEVGTKNEWGQEVRELDKEDLKNTRLMPFLKIDTSDSHSVIGHEGRHRMLALYRAGYTEVPVVIQDINEATKNNKIPMEDMDGEGTDLWSQDFGDGAINDDASIEVYDTIPINEKNRAEIERLYGAENEDQVQFSITDAVSDKVADQYDQTEEENGILLSKGSEPVSRFNKDGSAQFSIGSYEDEGRKVLFDYLDKQVKNKQLSKKDADDIKEQMELMYDICKRYADSGESIPFTNWSYAEVVRDDSGRPLFSAQKNNAEYKLNFDFSTICKKRRTLDAVLNEMIQRGMFNDMSTLSMNESAAMIANINDVIRDHGFEAACALCFVEARRYRQQKTAQDFSELYNELVQSLVPEGKDYPIDSFNFGENKTIKHRKDGIHTLSNEDLDFTLIDQAIKEGTKKGKGGRKTYSARAKAAMLIKGNPSQRRLVNVGDLMSSTGFTNMHVKNPDLEKVYNSKKGSGGAKSSFGDVQYLNDIIKKSRSFTQNAAYKVGGVRIQSFSDYVPRMVFDYIQLAAELSAKKLPAHSYTKEEMFAKQFGLTGIKINMSLVPDVVKGGIAPGLDADGNYAWNKDGTFDYDTAIEIQNTEGYGRNCGTIAVGISDEHIRKLLADPNIRMVIPYHKSSLNPIIAAMTNVDAFTDYTDFQNTKDENGNKVEKDFNWDKYLRAESLKGAEGDPQNVVRKYVEWCRQRNYTPKFSQFLYDESGEINPGYIKMLEDFSLYDQNGNFAPQGEVTMRFPTKEDGFRWQDRSEGAKKGAMVDGDMQSLIKAGLDEDAILEGKRTKNVAGIVDEIQQHKDSGKLFSTEVGAVKKDEAKTQFSISPAEDKAYMDAVKRGDMDEAQRMVDDAARRAGYDVKAYHQTAGDFTVFNTDNPQAGRNDSETPNGIFFKTNDHDIGLDGKKQIPVYLRTGRSLSFANREEANKWYRRNVKGYEDLDKTKDREVGALDERMNALEDLMFGEGVTDEEYDALNREWDALLEQMHSIEDGHRGKLRELLNDHFLSGDSEYDSIHLGYDGHRYVNGKREDVETYIVFGSDQAKLADPVTYDDSGDIIPLSERFNQSEQDIRFSIADNISAEERQSVSYDALISKPDMPIVRVEMNIQTDRKSAVQDGLNNIRQAATTIGKTGAKIYVKDVDDNLIIGRDALTHSLDRKSEDLQRIVRHAGDYLKNAVRINYVKPSHASATSAYILLAYGETEVGEPVPVYFVVDILQTGINKVVEFGRVYSMNGKKIGAVGTNALAFQGDSSPTISIEDLLFLVNGEFSDILSQDVLNHFGTNRKKTKLADQVKYSISDPSANLQKENEKLQRENDRLTKKIESLRAQFKQSKVPRPDEKQTNKAISELIKVYSDNKMDNRIHTAVKKEVEAIFEETRKAEPDWNVIEQHAMNAGRQIAEHSEVFRDESAGIYDELKGWLRKTKLHVPESVYQDLGGKGEYNEFRKANMEVLNLSMQDGTEIDSFYEELAGQYPWLFDAQEVSNPADQLRQIAEVMAGMKPYFESYSEGEMADVVMNIASDLVDMAYGLKQSRTFADRKKAEKDKALAKMKKQYEKRLEDQKKDLNQKAEKVKAERNKLMEKQRAEAKQRLDDREKFYKDKIKDIRQKYKDRKERKYYTERIKAYSEWLSDRLLRPTDTKHIPQGMQEAVAEMLYGFDFSTPLGDKWEQRHGRKSQKTLKFAKLRKQYDALIRSGDGWIEGDEDLADAIAELTRFENMRFADLEIEDLAQVYDVLKKVLETIRNANRTFNDNIRENISSLGEDVIGEMKAVREDKVEGTGWVHDIMNFLNESNVNPTDFFTTLGGTMETLYHEMRMGFDKFVDNVEVIKTFAEDLRKQHKDLKKWTGKKAKTKKFKLSSGATVEMTPAQVMSLYCSMKRPQARQHILTSGFAPSPQQRLNNVAQKLTKNLFAKGINSNVVLPTYEDVEMIINSLTDEQKAVADQVQNFMNTTCADWGNETSMKMYGYKKFTEKTYFPIRSSDQFLAKSFDNKQPSKLKNASMTKSLEPTASNPIVIDDIFQVLSDHGTTMAQYNGLVPAITDFERVMNYKQFSEDGRQIGTVRQALEGAYGKHITSYIDNFLSDLNQNYAKIKDHTIMNKLLANAKKGALGFNIRVFVQQPTAIFRAYAVLNPKYTVSAKTINLKKNKAEMQKINASARWKSYGFYNMDVSRDMYDVFLDNKDFASEVFMGSYGLADDYTWAVIWQSVKNEISDTRPDLEYGSPDYWQAVNERFDYVVDRTQVMDTPFHRSQIMRKQDMFTKLITAFMAEPTKTYNMLRTELILGWKAHKDGDNVKAAGHVSRVAAVMVANTAATAFAAGLVDILRDAISTWDDDDEEDDKTFWQKLVDHAKDNAMGNTISMIPVVSDIASIMQGYDVNRMDLQAFTQLKKTLDLMMKEEIDPMEKLKSASKTISYLTGIPAYNFLRDAQSTYVTVMEHLHDEDRAKYEAYSMRYKVGSDKNLSKYMGIYKEALMNGNEETADYILNDMIEKGYSEEDINEKMARSVNEVYKERVLDSANKGDAKGITDAIQWYQDIGYGDKDPVEYGGKKVLEAMYKAFEDGKSYEDVDKIIKSGIESGLLDKESVGEKITNKWSNTLKDGNEKLADQYLEYGLGEKMSEKTELSKKGLSTYHSFVKNGDAENAERVVNYLSERGLLSKSGMKELQAETYLNAYYDAKYTGTAKEAEKWKRKLLDEGLMDEETFNQKEDNLPKTGKAKEMLDGMKESIQSAMESYDSEALEQAANDIVGVGFYTAKSEHSYIRRALWAKYYDAKNAGDSKSMKKLQKMIEKWEGITLNGEKGKGYRGGSRGGWGRGGGGRKGSGGGGGGSSANVSAVGAQTTLKSGNGGSQATVSNAGVTITTAGAKTTSKSGSGANGYTGYTAMSSNPSASATATAKTASRSSRKSRATASAGGSQSKASGFRNYVMQTTASSPNKNRGVGFETTSQKTKSRFYKSRKADSWAIGSLQRRWEEARQVGDKQAMKELEKQLRKYGVKIQKQYQA